MQTQVMDAQASTQFFGRKRPLWLRPGLLWFAFDMLAPSGLFYLAINSGASIYLGLLASALLSAISAIISFLHGKGGQRFAPYMLAMALASLALALVTGSDRFLLAKESVLTVVVGFWFLGSIWTPRPLTYRLPVHAANAGREIWLAGTFVGRDLGAGAPVPSNLVRLDGDVGVVTLIDSV